MALLLPIPGITEATVREYPYETMSWPLLAPTLVPVPTPNGYLIVGRGGAAAYTRPGADFVDFYLRRDVAVPLAAPDDGRDAYVLLQMPEYKTRYAKRNEMREPEPEEIPAWALDTSCASLGYVHAAARGTEPLILRISNGETSHNTRIPADGQWHPFLLTLGAGQYTVSIDQAGLGDKVVGEVVTLELGEITPPPDTTLALYSSAHVNINDNPAIVEKARSLCEGIDDDLEKFKRIRAFLYRNARYDTDTARYIQYTKIPEPSVFLENGGRGICGDYASFLAVACRAVGIPCKMVSGINPNTGNSHGWNVVMLEGRWQLVDVVSEKSRKQKDYVPLGLAESGYKAVPWYWGGYD